MKHNSGGVTQWHRGYHYAASGNQLVKTSLPGDDVNDEQTYTAPYSYDEHGSMTAISSIPGGLTWDPQDRLQQSGHLGGGDVYYVYDSAGMRARKVWVNQGGTTSKERFYVGPWETYRETTDLQGTPTLDLERETLHVDDAAGAACLIETRHSPCRSSLLMASFQTDREERQGARYMRNLTKSPRGKSRQNTRFDELLRRSFLKASVQNQNASGLQKGE